MIHFLVSRKEYENIKNNKETMVVVEAKSEHPMYVDISPHGNKNSNSDYSSYENAVFNGECDKEDRL